MQLTLSLLLLHTEGRGKDTCETKQSEQGFRRRKNPVKTISFYSRISSADQHHQKHIFWDSKIQQLNEIYLISLSAHCKFINAHVDSLDAAEDYYDLKVLFIIQPIVPNEYTVSSYHSQGKKNIQGKMFLFSSFFFFLPLVAYSSLLPSTKEDSLASNRTGLLVVGGHKPEYEIGKDTIWFQHTHHTQVSAWN